MRDIIVFAFVMLSLPTCFRRPFYGLLVFSWLAYMRPQDLCWGFARTMRLSFLVAAAMVTGWWAVERGRRRFARWDYRSVSIVVLGLMITISYAFAYEQTQYTNTYFFEFIKILMIALFTTGQVDSKHRFKVMVWTIALCLAFFGVKGGIFGILSGGTSQIIRGPGGMMEDNNDFALALVMNIPLLWYLGMSERKKPWIAKLCKVGVFLTVITIVLTQSRGAFLALTATSLWIAWRSGKFIRAAGLLAFLGLVFLAVAPQDVLDRLQSINTEESSANARLMAWSTALNMIAGNPVWGVGMRNFQTRYREYATHELDDVGRTHVAHNSYLQIWAESGTLAFIVYFALLLSVFVACRRLYRMGRSRPDLQWVADYARMMEATTIGFMVGAFFLNRGHFDLVYHWFALVTALVAVGHRAFRADPELSMTRRVRIGEAAQTVTVKWRDDPGGERSVPTALPSTTLPSTTVGSFAMPRWQRRT